ncbi:MAG TPA: hypothetical protein VFR35_19445, partial [Actinoplanes sp.]|nr:hypothetical protein [Actinoplanes sp.]
MATLAVSTIMVIVGCALALLLWSGRSVTPPAAQPTCATAVRVVSAASYAPVLSTLAPALAAGEDCARLEVNLRGFDPVGAVLEPAAAARRFLDALGVPPQRIPADPE